MNAHGGCNGGWRSSELGPIQLHLALVVPEHRDVLPLDRHSSHWTADCKQPKILHSQPADEDKPVPCAQRAYCTHLHVRCGTPSCTTPPRRHHTRPRPHTPQTLDQPAKQQVAVWGGVGLGYVCAWVCRCGVLGTCMLLCQIQLTTNSTRNIQKHQAHTWTQ